MTTFNPNDPTASGMVLTFDDEFNSNDTSNTGISTGAQWANHLWYDPANPGAVSVSNGVLSLASGGELSTVNSSGAGFSQEYGYFEVDMKVPAGIGTWPAFWMMSLDHMINPSAPASEIDIIEGQGNQQNGYYTTLHSNTGSGADQFNPDPNFTGNVSSAPLSSQYDSFGVLWSPTSDQLTFYFNGTAVATANDYSTTNSSPMAVLIDNWLGDIGWGGNSPTAGASYGPLQVDNVRVYQFAGQGATAIAAQPVSAAAGQGDPAMLLSAAGGTTTGASDPLAAAPSLTVTNASASEGSSTALSITAAQASSSLAAADLTVTVSNLDGATLNHGALANGVYTLQAADLSGLTVTPASGFTGTLALNVTATDTEPSSSTSASSATQTLDVTVTAPVTTGSGSSSGAHASPNDTVVVGTSGDIVTAAGNAFAINSAGQITENGTVIAATHGVTELAYVNNTLYQEATAQNLWFSLNETTTAGTLTSDPLPSPSGTVVVGTNGSILTAAGNNFAIDSAGQITENGTALAITNSVTELAYVNNTLYQEATSQNLWWSFNETTGTWTQTSDPLTAPAGTAAVAPTLSVTNASANEGSSTALTIAAAQSSSSLAAADLTVTVSNLDGATLNHGTLANGVYTLHAADLSGLTVTPAAGFAGTLALDVTATDTEPSSSTSASSAMHTLDVTVNPTAAAPTLSLADPSGNEGSAIPISITAAQFSSSLAAADLTVTVGNLDGATLNHGTLANGVYTLHASDLSGLTVTPAAGFIGTLALDVTATDTESSSSTTASSAMQTLDVTVNPTAVAPSLSVTNASASEGSAIPLSIAAAQSSSSLAAADLTVTVSNLDGATLNHGTLANGVYTLHASDLSGLTVTPAAGFTGTLALDVTATDTESSSSTSASSAMHTLDVTVNPTAAAAAAEAPSLSVTNASGGEGSSIALAITAAQESSGLAAADLTVMVGNLDGATLNHGSLANGVYTLHASDLSGLTVTPEAGFTGTLALSVTATDTEAASGTSASSAMHMLDVTVTAPATTGSGASDPTPSPNDTIVLGTSGDILTAAGNSFAIDSAGQITENGMVIAATHGVTELAYVGNTLYQEATAQNLWFSMNETTTAGTLTSDPLPASTSGSGTSAAPTETAMTPLLSVYEASGGENGSIPVYIYASQASSALSSSNLSITVSGLDNATLNHGTETNGVYTLHAADLSGLTVTPAANFTGTLALNVTATDTEGSSNAASVSATLDVAVAAAPANEVLLQPSFSDGGHNLYLLTSLSTANDHIASFNPATDILDLAPLLKLDGYTGSNPIADHVVNLEPTSNGGTAVMIDPTGVSPTHGTTVVTLDHVLPTNVPAADIWH